MLPEQAAIMTAAGAERWACFFRMSCKSSVVRAWTGVGDFEVPADDVDLEGGIYLGVGLVGDMPGLRQLVGGIAERIEFALNGADERTFRLADDQVDEGGSGSCRHRLLRRRLAGSRTGGVALGGNG